MSSARVDYIAPWWTYWLHNFPHINLRFQPTDNSFQPEEENYQQVSAGGPEQAVLTGHMSVCVICIIISADLCVSGDKSGLLE